MEKLNIKTEKKNLFNERIESERLLLVPISAQYRKEIFEEFTADITTYMFPAPAKDISETDKFIEEASNNTKEGIDLQIVVLSKESQEFLGCGGLHHINSETPELGIWIKKSAHGQGYGGEAVTALKKWADENIDYKYLKYPVADKNISSRKIPESLGGKIESEYEYEGMAGNKFHCLEYRIYCDKK